MVLQLALCRCCCTINTYWILCVLSPLLSIRYRLKALIFIYFDFFFNGGGRTALVDCVLLVCKLWKKGPLRVVYHCIIFEMRTPTEMGEGKMDSFVVSTGSNDKLFVVRVYVGTLTESQTAEWKLMCMRKVTPTTIWPSATTTYEQYTRFTISYNFDVCRLAVFCHSLSFSLLTPLLSLTAIHYDSFEIRVEMDEPNVISVIISNKATGSVPFIPTHCEIFNSNLVVVRFVREPKSKMCSNPEEQDACTSEMMAAL